MRRSAAGILIALLAAAASPARAHFERPVSSSRQLAMGGALVSLVDDASAAVVGPASLVQLHRWSAVATYQQPYGVGDLDEMFAAAAIRVPGIGAAGVAVHHVGLRDVMSESVITLALARDLIRTSEDASLSLGASVDYARVSVSDRLDASDGVVTGGAGVLLRPFPAIGLAYSVRNIYEGEFDLAAGGGTTTLERTQSWGASWVWHQRVAVSWERRNDEGRWRDRLGVEVDLGPYLDVRSGVGAGTAGGGIGISWGNVSVDAGYSSHEFLGATYVITLGYTPPAPVNPYAQNP